MHTKYGMVRFRGFPNRKEFAMTAPQQTQDRTAPRSPFRSDTCPDHCDSCAWGIGGESAVSGSTAIPLVSRTLTEYRSECGAVEVVLTGSNTVGAIHGGRFFPGRKTPALQRLLAGVGLMPLG